MTVRVASWAAVSSEVQVVDKVSLGDQLRVNREHAERIGGRIVEELIVPGQSRSIVLFEDAAREIAAYKRLKELIDQRLIDVLIFLDRSRLGRISSLSMAVVELCREAGIVCYETDAPPASLDAARQSSHDEMLIGAIKSVGAQREIVKFQERHRMGMIGRIQRGEIPTRVPFGWCATYDDTTGKRVLRIDDDAARIVRLALVDLYLEQGLGGMVVAEQLNARGYRTRTGKLWTVGNLKTLFERLWRYAGYTEINAKSKRNRTYVRAKGDFPAILTENEVSAIIAERTARKASRRSITYPDRLSRVVWCNHHNCNAFIHHTKPKNRPSVSVRCRCKWCVEQKRASASISGKRVIAALRAYFTALSDPAFRDAIKNKQGQSATKRVRAAIGRHRDAIKQAELALARADSAFVRLLMDAARYERIVTEMNAEIAQHRAEIERLSLEQSAIADEQQRNSRIDATAHNGVSMLDNPDARTANAWLRRHVRVYIDGNTIVRIESL